MLQACHVPMHAVTSGDDDDDSDDSDRDGDVGGDGSDR